MNTLSIQMFETICRICLFEKKDLKSIFDACVPDMIMECTSIVIKEGDGLPIQICTQCIQQINRSFRFKQTCRRSDVLLHECLSNAKNNRPESEITTPHSNVLSTNTTPTILKVEPSETTRELENCSKVIIEKQGPVPAKDFLTETNIPLSSDTQHQFDDSVNNCETIEDTTLNENYVLDTISDSQDVSAAESLSCSICAKVFKVRCKLISHMKLHTGEKENVCNICQKSFSVPSLLAKHSKTHAADRDKIIKERRTMINKPYRCTKCDKGFIELQTLKKHVKEQHDGKKRVYEKKHMCTVCGKRFCNSSWLDVHMRKHTGERPLTCETCGKTFYMPSSLNKHMLIHGEKKHKCTVCNKAFTQGFQLKIHNRIHTGERPYICSVCGKGTTTSEALTVHMRTHTGEKPFRCQMCDNAFASRSQLTIHTRRHAGIKPYGCPTCARFFLQKGDLDTHIRYHTGERPYACKVCPKKFFAHSALRVHMMGHTGEKPHACSVCGKRFVSSHVLKTHMRAHTGERPYACLLCGHRFSQSGALATHLKGHK